ncbi:OmpA family protein [Tabrizicola sp.]|uniref:OmpA family protein n=1 Tax=Tabrizicola sp. TaxID=2005166 RepID=UPI0035B29028
MGFTARVAAFLVAIVTSFPALAQDVTLIAREGGIVLSGALQGFDGEFYRIQTSYGLLTVDGQGVICEGPACPDLVAPRAVIRITGAGDVGADLLEPLFRSFAAKRGLIYEDRAQGAYAAALLDPDSRKELAVVSFQPLPPDPASAALAEGNADLKLSFLPEATLVSHALALDALAAIVAPDNPTPEISTTSLARVLSGEVTNWARIGGPDMPIVLHALEGDTDMQRALAARIGAPVAATVLHPDQQSLAAAVALDPWALAIIGRANIGPARRIPLTDSCGFPLLPTPLAVKAEDYPLALPVLILAPKRRLPLMTREFLEFLRSPAAQEVIAARGYIDRSPSRQPMTADGLRLINAIQGAGEDITLADLKRLVDLMDGADRLSLTFRFEDGSSTLDTTSRENLADLAQIIASGRFRNERMVLAGFSDGSGAAAANLALSLERAGRVAQELAALAPDLPPEALPAIDGFGEALPMACDETAIGRQLNRRVELWLVPHFPESDAPSP